MRVRKRTSIAKMVRISPPGVKGDVYLLEVTDQVRRKLSVKNKRQPTQQRELASKKP